MYSLDSSVVVLKIVFLGMFLVRHVLLVCVWVSLIRISGILRSSISFFHSALYLKDYPHGHVNIESLLLTSAQGSVGESSTFHFVFKKKFPWVMSCFKLVRIWKYVPFAITRDRQYDWVLKKEHHSFFAFKLWISIFFKLKFFIYLNN